MLYISKLTTAKQDDSKSLDSSQASNPGGVI